MGMIPLQLRQALADRKVLDTEWDRFHITVRRRLTPAQLNAGADLIPNVGPGFLVGMVNIHLEVDTATITGLATLRISDRASTPNDLLSIAQASLTSGAKFNQESAGVTTTIANIMAGSTTGLQARAVGGTAAGGNLNVIITVDLRPTT